MALDKGKDTNTNDFRRIFRESFISEDLRVKIQGLDPTLRETILEMENQLILFSDRIETLECVTDEHLREEREQTKIDVERINWRISQKLLAHSKQVAALAIALFGLGALWVNLSDTQRQKVAGSFYDQFMQQISPIASAAVAGALLVNGRSNAKEAKGSKSGADE